MLTKEFLEILKKWYKTLIIVFVLSSLLSFVFTSEVFIKPRYRVKTTIYPSNLSKYSTETFSEQLMQLLLSDNLKYKVVDTLKLYKYYNIDTSRYNGKIKILNILNNRLKIRKTNFDAVEVSFIDKDIEFARKLIKVFLQEYNKLATELLRIRISETLTFKKNLYLQKQKIIDTIQTKVDSIIKKSDLIEYNLLKESVRGNYEKLFGPQRIQNVNNIKNFGLELYYYQTLLEKETNQLLEYQKEYEIALIDYNKQLQFANVVSGINLPAKKVYPVRWLICLISVLSTTILAFITIIFIEKNKS